MTARSHSYNVSEEIEPITESSNFLQSMYSSFDDRRSSYLDRRCISHFLQSLWWFQLLNRILAIVSIKVASWRFARRWSSFCTVTDLVRASFLSCQHFACVRLSVFWHILSSVLQWFFSFLSFSDLHISHSHQFWYHINVASINRE